MPFKSEAQRRFMHAKHPTIAKRWEREYPTSVLPKRVGEKREGKMGKKEKK